MVLASAQSVWKLMMVNRLVCKLVLVGWSWTRGLRRFADLAYFKLQIWE